MPSHSVPSSCQAAAEQVTILPQDAGLRLDHFLAQRYPQYSRSALNKLITAAQVLVDAQPVEHAGLRVHPVFHRDDGERGAIRLAGGRIGVHGPRRAEAGAQIVDADDKELVGIDGLARTDQVIPPALTVGLVGIGSGHVVATGQGVADQDGITALGIEFAVGFEDQFETGQRGAARQGDRLVEAHPLGDDLADGRFLLHRFPENKKPLFFSAVTGEGLTELKDVIWKRLHG